MQDWQTEAEVSYLRKTVYGNYQHWRRVRNCFMRLNNMDTAHPFSSVMIKVIRKVFTPCAKQLDLLKMEEAVNRIHRLWLLSKYRRQK